MRQATAAELRKNTAGIIRAPRRMPVAEAVHKYMRVPVGVGNSVTQSEETTAEQQANSRKTQAKRNEQKMTLTGPCRPKHVPLTAEAGVTTSGFGSREDRAWVVESLVFSLTSAGFSYTYNLVVDIRKPAAASKKSEKQDKTSPSYFG